MTGFLTKCHAVTLALLCFFSKVHMHRRSDELLDMQCPCVKSPDGTYNCQPYDQNLMAVTEQEAILNFRNPIEPKSDIPLLQETQQMTLKCKTDLCKACSAQKIRTLMKKQFISMVWDCPQHASFNEAQIGTVDAINNVLKFGIEVMHGKRPLTDLTNFENQIKLLSGLGDLLQKPFAPRIFSSLSRSRRQAPADELGDIRELECVNRGDVSTDNPHGYVPLCTQCWAWRVLPENYYPRYINEFTCKEGDELCLSGYASCIQSNLPLTVLRRNNDGNWGKISLRVKTSCDCKVKSGSILHAWVSK